MSVRYDFCLESGRNVALKTKNIAFTTLVPSISSRES
jgi:hypothetical protein